MRKRKLFIAMAMFGSFVLLSSCNLSSQDISTSKNDMTATDLDISTETTTKEEDTSPDITKYLVSFETNGGNIISSEEVEAGSKITKPADPIKEGYVFAGWYSSSYFLIEYNFNNLVFTDLTLYAKWNEIPKKVSYEEGISTVDLWTDSIDTRWMKITVPVTNTGESNLYLNDISIDIEDLSGNLLQTVTYVNGYPEYLKPGETGYYYEETTCDFSETSVKAVPNLQVEKSSNNVIRYDISDVSITTDMYNGVKILGRVQNNTQDNGSLVKIAANLYDVNGNLICNCYTYLENDLASGAKVGFSITPFAFRNLSPSDVASYELYAYPYQYNW